MTETTIKRVRTVGDALTILAAYDRQVRANTTDAYDAVAAVAEDDTGEVIFEVLEMADALGFDLWRDDSEEYDDAGIDLLSDAAHSYKGMLATEVGLR